MLRGTVLKMNGQSKNMSLSLSSWKVDAHSASRRFCAARASSLLQSCCSLLLPNRLIFAITQRLNVNIWPLFLSFFGKCSTRWSQCTDQLSQSQAHQNTGASVAPVGRILDLASVCSWNTETRIQMHAKPLEIKANVWAWNCNAPILSRTHKGGVYSIAMVIKPDWKACRHICACVC